MATKGKKLTRKEFDRWTMDGMGVRVTSVPGKATTTPAAKKSAAKRGK